MDRGPANNTAFIDNIHTDAATTLTLTTLQCRYRQKEQRNEKKEKTRSLLSCRTLGNQKCVSMLVGCWLATLVYLLPLRVSFAEKILC